MSTAIIIPKHKKAASRLRTEVKWNAELKRRDRCWCERLREEIQVWKFRSNTARTKTNPHLTWTFDVCEKWTKFRKMSSDHDPNLHANLPGTASLIAELDRKQVKHPLYRMCIASYKLWVSWGIIMFEFPVHTLQMVLLRDGRTLIGTLRSVDQFANLVLQDCIERIHVGKQFGDIPRGIFVVRGENVVRQPFWYSRQLSNL